MARNGFKFGGHTCKHGCEPSFLPPAEARGKGLVGNSVPVCLASQLSALAPPSSATALWCSKQGSPLPREGLSQSHHCLIPLQTRHLDISPLAMGQEDLDPSSRTESEKGGPGAPLPRFLCWSGFLMMVFPTQALPGPLSRPVPVRPPAGHSARCLPPIRGCCTSGCCAYIHEEGSPLPT